MPPRPGLSSPPYSLKCLRQILNIRWCLDVTKRVCCHASVTICDFSGGTMGREHEERRSPLFPEKRSIFNVPNASDQFNFQASTQLPSSLAQHIAHQALYRFSCPPPLTRAGYENTGRVIDVIVVQFIVQFADQLKWHVKVLVKVQYLSIIKS